MTTTSAQKNPDVLEKALDLLLQSEYPLDQPGIVVGIWLQGKPICLRARGVADVRALLPLSAATNFRMASITKQFTAACIALLEKEGLISFHEKLTAYIPGFTGQLRQIQVWHLLTHTSGLLDYEAFVSEHRSTQVTDDEVLKLSAAQTNTYFKPGTRFRYSNTGFVLLGLLVQRISGKTFHDFLLEQIFEPLQMAHSTLYSPPAEITHRAMGYARTLTGQIIFSDQSPCSATQGDGCLYTSLQEYALWHQAMLHHPRFQLLPLLQKVSASIPEHPNGHYGMGWFYSTRQDGTFELCHSGNTCGFSHLVVSVPEEQALVVAFSNLADNAFLYDKLLPTISRLAPFRLESDLVYALPELTR
ncbi:MAG: serine hydrolase domain-containing protein [Rufibacter sp.]